MKTFLAAIIVIFCAVTAYAQTIKSLSYNTTNGQVVYTGTNPLTFTNEVRFGGGDLQLAAEGAVYWANELRFEVETLTVFSAINFDSPTIAATTRTNLGLGATNNAFSELRGALNTNSGESINLDNLEFFGEWSFDNAVFFAEPAFTRTNLGLGATNNVAFRSIASDGNIVISNQSAATNGLLFIYRTNNEPFLGLANLIASNNTTVSNESLFRVGVAEATNKSAQFGFRSTNTNGNGVAVFSVFGYNALAMIGPSSRSATNTNGIEADIYSINPTNKVATLIDTNTGATLMHRPVGFNTNASAPANTTNVVGWIQFYVGTNSVRVPYYQ